MLLPIDLIMICFALQEPESIFGELKVFPLAKLDRAPSISSLKEFVQAEELRFALLTLNLTIHWYCIILK